MNKSTIKEIRERFDTDVERFSNLETGQVSTIDATITLELITESAKRINPGARNLLDIGCGAGNYTLKMLTKLPDLNCTLLDLSKPMLDRAYERVSAASTGIVTTIQEDIREIELQNNHYDIVLASAVLHHLREDSDWELVFSKLFSALSPGGCLMISDLITQDSEILSNYIREKYAQYLEEIGGEAYKLKILDLVEKEDSPRSLIYQLDLMRKVGFRSIDVLHKSNCFAAFCGIK